MHTTEHDGYFFVSVEVCDVVRCFCGGGGVADEDEIKWFFVGDWGVAFVDDGDGMLFRGDCSELSSVEGGEDGEGGEEEFVEQMVSLCSHGDVFDDENVHDEFTGFHYSGSRI